MNRYERTLKPAFNYSAEVTSVADSLDNGTFGIGKFIFPMSTSLSAIKTFKTEIENAGYGDKGSISVIPVINKNEGDYILKMEFWTFEDYKIALRELIVSFDVAPLSAIYTPSQWDIGKNRADREETEEE